MLESGLSKRKTSDWRTIVPPTATRGRALPIPAGFPFKVWFIQRDRRDKRVAPLLS